MAVPGYQEFMLPLLRLVDDKREYSLRDVVEAVANRMRLTPEDRKELLPSGSETKLYNRVQWGATYLKKSGLIESPARGRFKITDLGLKILAENPPTINNAFLRRFPSFVEFTKAKPPEEGKNNSRDEEKRDSGESNETPKELLESNYRRLREALASELLERVKRNSPGFFERLVIDVLTAMGYGAGRPDAGIVVGQPGDGGIDGIINEDKLGLGVVYVQAKRWEHVVGRPDVQAFAGSLDGRHATKGVLITPSWFSAEAKDYVARIGKRIALIDGERLAELMIDYGIGVTVEKSFVVKVVDGDYFDET